MATATSVEAPQEKSTVGGRVVEACREAAHLSHEARLLKSVAEDAIEDGMHAAKRAIKTVRHRVEDVGEKLEGLKDDAVYRVKRHPLRAVGTAVGVGVALGLAVGWIVYRLRRHE